MQENRVELHQQSENNDSKELIHEHGDSESGKDDDVMEQKFDDTSGLLIDEKIQKIVEQVASGHENLRKVFCFVGHISDSTHQVRGCFTPEVDQILDELLVEK